MLQHTVYFPTLSLRNSFLKIWYLIIINMIIKDWNWLMRDSLSAKTNKVLICYCLADPVILCLFTTPTYPLSGPQSVLHDAYRQYHTHQ